jgi:hypothetical protein
LANVEIYARNWVDGQDGMINLQKLFDLLNPPKPEKAPRFFPGVAPQWGQLPTGPGLVNADQSWWLVSVRDDYKKTPLWRDVKVFARQAVPDKANYSLSWNTKVGYFADGDALKLMKAYRPALLTAVSNWLLQVTWPK